MSSKPVYLGCLLILWTLVTVQVSPISFILYNLPFSKRNSLNRKHWNCIRECVKITQAKWCFFVLRHFDIWYSRRERKNEKKSSSSEIKLIHSIQWIRCPIQSSVNTTLSTRLDLIINREKKMEIDLNIKHITPKNLWQKYKIFETSFLSSGNIFRFGGRRRYCNAQYEYINWREWRYRAFLGNNIDFTLTHSNESIHSSHWLDIYDFGIFSHFYLYSDSDR